MENAVNLTATAQMRTTFSAISPLIFTGKHVGCSDITDILTNIEGLLWQAGRRYLLPFFLQYADKKAGSGRLLPLPALSLRFSESKTQKRPKPDGLGLFCVGNGKN